MSRFVCALFSIAAIGMFALQACDSSSGPGGSGESDSTRNESGGKDTVVQLPPDTSLPGSKAVMIDTASFGLPATDSVAAAAATWFRVEVYADSVYRISGLGLPGRTGVGKADIKLTVLSQAEDRVLASVDDVGDSRDPVVVVRAPADGYLRVKVEVGKSALAGFFSLTVTKMDRWESNDSMTNAKRVDPVAGSVASLMESDGRDWFSFRTKVGRFYQFDMVGEVKSVRFVGSNGKEFPSNEVYLSGQRSQVLQATDSVVFLDFAGSTTGIAGGVAYSFRMRELENDSLEPDGSFAQASKVEIEKTSTRIIAPYDVDRLKFPVKAGFIYELSITSEVDLHGSLYSRGSDTSSQGKLVEAGEDYKYHGFVAAPEDGFMYLRLNADDSGKYKVDVKENSPDTSEPDTPARAPLLSGDGSSVKRFMLRNDTDLVSVDGQPGTEYAVSVNFLGQALKVGVRAATGAVQTVSDGYVRCLTAGRFQFVITTGYSEGSYTVTLKTRKVGMLPVDGTPTSRNMTSSTEWLDIHLESGVDYRYRVQSVGGNVSVALYSLDSIATTPALRLASGSSDSSVLHRVGKTGDYRLRVVRASTATSSYTLSIRPEANDSLEPNDSSSQATRLRTDSTVVRGVISIGDLDHFRMSTVPGRKYVVYGGSRDYSDVELTGNPRGTLLGSYSGYSGKAGLVFEATDTVSWILVRPGISLGTTSRMSYALAAVEFVEDSLEPDDSYAKAAPISVDSSVQSRTLSLGNTDNLRIAVRKNLVYTVFMSSDADVAVLVKGNDTAAASLSTTTIYSTSPRIYTFSPKADGTVYFRFTTTQLSAKYRVAVTESGHDEFEPDESLSSSPEIKVGADPVKRYFSFYRDPDWFKFQADSGRFYNLSLPRNDGESVTFEFYGADSVKVPSSQSKMLDGSSASFLCTKSGVYHVRMYPYDSGAYTAKLSVADTASWSDVYENDNLYSLASPMSTDGVFRRMLLSYGNEDWVKFPVDSGDALSVAVINSSNYEFSLRLHATDSVANVGSFTVLTSGNGSNDTSYATVVAKSNGWIRARLSTNSGMLQSYAISATILPKDSLEPDSVMALAATVPTDSSVIHRNIWNGDNDWMAFDADSGATYTVKVAGEIDQKLYTYWYDPAGKRLGSNASTKVEFSLTATKAGRYSFLLSGENLRKVLPYSVSVFKEP